MASTKDTTGFTLVELAIVLVILGLLIGGVLVGQDLVRSATINATIRDIARFDAAATTFRAKYKSLPGDMTPQKALTIGFNTALTDASRNGQPGLGDGNEVIEGGAAGSTNLSGETGLFWDDLNKAGLVAGISSPYRTTDTPNLITTGASVVTGNYVARAKISYSSVVHVFANTGRNYYAMGGMSVTLGVVNGAANSGSAGLTPLEARSIDEKLDDSLPSSGNVLALPNDPFPALNAGSVLTPITPVASAPGICSTSDTTPPTYTANTDSELTSVACLMAIRAAF